MFNNNIFSLQIPIIFNYLILTAILLTFWLILEHIKITFEENIKLKLEINELKGSEKINSLINYKQFLKSVSQLIKEKDEHATSNYLLKIVLKQEIFDKSKTSFFLTENLAQYFNYKFNSITQPEKNEILVFLQNTNTNELKENINKLVDKISADFSLMILPFSMYIYNIESSIEETLKKSSPVFEYEYLINTSNINNNKQHDINLLQ